MSVTNDPVVYIVDDDPQMLQTLRLLVDSVGYQVQTYKAAEEFFEDRSRLGKQPECLILDLCLPGMDGVSFHAKLIEEGINIPIIMISAFGDIPTAVNSIKLGAVDFLEKPFNRVDLLRQIRVALDKKTDQLAAQEETEVTAARLTMLTSREREILDRMVIGETTKQIAELFDISTKTVAKHQTRVLSKMGVTNAVELVHLMKDLK